MFRVTQAYVVAIYQVWTVIAYIAEYNIEPGRFEMLYYIRSAAKRDLECRTTGEPAT